MKRLGAPWRMAYVMGPRASGGCLFCAVPSAGDDRAQLDDDLHVVPRGNGDNNFVPVVRETRVLPEALGVTDARLKGRRLA